MSPFAVAGRLVLPTEAGSSLGAVIVQGGVISEIKQGPGPYGYPTVRADVVAPGFIDLQVNGGFGVDLASGPDGLARLAAALPKTGVTSFLPTLPSPTELEVTALANAVRTAGEGDPAKAQGKPPAAALGLHLEGPLLSPERTGAHEAAVIERCTAESFEALTKLAAVKLVTMAPERTGSLALIGRLVRAGVTVSLGHTSATFDDFRAGIDAGATMATHVFQAMTPFHHRAPGALGAALLDDRVNVSLIADGVHTHPAALDLALRCKGAGGIILVTDAMAGAGMPDGVYPLGKKQVKVSASKGRATLVGGTGADVANLANVEGGTLAGSVLTMDQAVRNMVAWLGISIDEALRMAAQAPADALGLTTRGRLIPGAVADLVLLDETQQIFGTLVAGRWAVAPTGMLDLFRAPS